MQTWTVHKFGGTSVRDAAQFRAVLEILRNWQGPQAVVVSAMKGTTDDLIQCVERAKRQDPSWESLLASIRNRHEAESKALLGPRADGLRGIFERDFAELTEILRGVWLTQSATEEVTEIVSGMGEVWSAQILNAVAREQGLPSLYLDAREILVVEKKDRRVLVDWATSEKKFQDWKVKTQPQWVAITGFVARSHAGTKTTLGRNGSDYSGSIFGRLFQAKEVLIWTDVDGVLSADPRLVPDARVLSEMSYTEMSELAYFGAKVVHPSTMSPVMELGIPIRIKNTFNPQHPGTLISRSSGTSGPLVKGFSTVDRMCLLNLEGSGLAGIPGVAERLFAALRAARISVVLISQASSEQSICVAIPEDQSSAAQQAVSEAFGLEMSRGLVRSPEVVMGVSILAAVGDQMAHRPGVAGQFFSALGMSGVNVRAIAQGSSERNISAVIDGKDAGRALRTVHSVFVHPHHEVALALIGPGLIGSTFLDQVAARQKELKERHKVDLQLIAIANSRKMLLTDKPVPLEKWRQEFENSTQSIDEKLLAEHLRKSQAPHRLVIDATASDQWGARYEEWLRSGFHLITPNKKASSGALPLYQSIRQAAFESSRQFLNSTNVGAGLPILQTLRDLVATGDEILRIEGVLSGTLSYLFNSFQGDRGFSSVLKDAMEKGFTEPDPREDLSGQDFARKLVILAREAGAAWSLEDIEVRSLVPKNLQGVSKEEFLGRMSELDPELQVLWQKASSQQRALRYIGVIDFERGARLGLEEVPLSHPFVRMSGSDNMVLIQTRRYHSQPLVIQGPGAGPEVTAAGVFADLLRVIRSLGAKS